MTENISFSTIKDGILNENSAKIIEVELTKIFSNLKIENNKLFPTIIINELFD